MDETLSQAEFRREALALLNAGGRAYYRDADMGMVRRIGGGALAVIALVSAAILPLAPPTAHVQGGVGWPLTAALLVAAGVAAGFLLRGSGQVTVGVSVAVAVGAVIGIEALDTLAATDAPYDKLVVLVIVWAGATHTLRRVLAIIAVAGAARIPSLAEAAWAPAEAAEALVQVVVWFTLGALALVWTAGVRAQRGHLRRERSRAAALARVDALTGLGNRRAFDEMAAAELARAERTGRPLCLLVADLDAFKAINDDHGHLAGDACLRQVAAVVSSTVRRPDACFRWGGDEFALLLTDTGLGDAQAVGERLAETVAATCRAPGGRALTVGVGVAQHDGDETLDELLARADRALLAAKA